MDEYEHLRESADADDNYREVQEDLRRIAATLDATRPSGDAALRPWSDSDTCCPGARVTVHAPICPANVTYPIGDEALDEVLTDTLTPWHGTVADDDDGMLRRCIDIQCMGTSEVVQRDFTGSITVRHKPGCAVVECFRRAALATTSSAPDVEGLDPLRLARLIVSYADLTHEVVVQGRDWREITDEWSKVVDECRAALRDSRS